MSAFDPKDGGTKSRKLWFSVFTVMVLLFGMWYASRHESVAPLYGELVGGIVAIAGLYLAGNIAGKFTIGKNMNATKPPKEEEEPLPRPSPEK